MPPAQRDWEGGVELSEPRNEGRGVCPGIAIHVSSEVLPQVLRRLHACVRLGELFISKQSGTEQDP